MGAHADKGRRIRCVYLPDAAMSASMGLPDLGIITVHDVCFFIKQIVRASGLPVLVERGYGLRRGAECHALGSSRR
jgi:methylisocitrate lyase